MADDPRDPFNLTRFIDAQASAYEAVLSELKAGHKRTHWSWYIFPQLRGLGVSEMAQYYGITSLDEARAYLAHPVLGARLRECVKVMNGLPDVSASTVLGYVDAMKFRSCLTLFHAVDKSEAIFAEALEKYYKGEPDSRTLVLLPRN